MHDVPGTAAVVLFGTGIVVKSADREGRVNDRPVRAAKTAIVMRDLAIIRPNGTAGSTA